MGLADRTWQHLHIAEAEVLPLEAEALARPGALENVDRFERAPEAFFARYLKARELFLAIPQANAEPQAPVGDHVDKRGIFGEA